MTMTLAARKKLCLEYVKEARRLWGTPDHAWRGQGPQFYLSAAAALLPPNHKAELRPHAQLIVAIRKRFLIDMDARQPARLTIRQKQRRGLLPPTEARTYADHCAWPRRRAQEQRRYNEPETCDLSTALKATRDD